MVLSDEMQGGTCIDNFSVLLMVITFFSTDIPIPDTRLRSSIISGKQMFGLKLTMRCSTSLGKIFINPAICDVNRHIARVLSRNIVLYLVESGKLYSANQKAVGSPNDEYSVNPLDYGIE